MRGAVFLLACLLAGPAVADDAALLDFMGGQGCTFGTDSRAAAVAAGFDESLIDALVDDSLTDGTAVRQRAYVVLGEDICTIRLPDIQSAYTVASPEILAITSAIDAYADQDVAGCFIEDAAVAFDALRGGAQGAGFDDFISFVGAGLISGEVRFYSPDILQTPISFQVTTGACADVPNIDAIRRSHVFVASGFGDYIRLLGSESSCDGVDSGFAAFEFPARLQGIDPNAPPENRPEINAWLFFEYDMIAFAAGWYEGMTGTEKGAPRPPLCYYP